MDEQHTKKMLDDLADLFLTDELAKPAEPRGNTDRAPVRLESAAEVEPIPIREARCQDDELTSSPALRLHSPEPQMHPPDEEMLPADHPPPVAARPRIEAVFLGNLPGFGGPWLTQYAQLLADRDGPVAIIHLDEDQVDVERVLASALPPIAVAYRPTDERDTAAMLQLLQQLGPHGESPVAVVLVTLPSQATDWMLRIASAIDHWTVLCGADDAAAVSAYRLLKQLAGEAGACDDEAKQKVALAVMGSDTQLSEAVAEKISLAAVNFLHMPVDLVASIRKMAPVNVQPLGNFDVDRDAWQLIASVLDGQAPQPPQSADAQQITPAQKPSEPLTIDGEPPAIMTSGAAVATPEPRTSELDASFAAAATEEPDLVSFVSAAVALRARCPRHPQIQLLIDPLGCVHLQARHEGDAVELRAVLVDLMDCRTWVREHLELLQLTQPQKPFDLQGDPALHLFTSDAKAAAALVGQLGELLKIHLLQQVHVGQASTWISSDLN